MNLHPINHKDRRREEQKERVDIILGEVDGGISGPFAIGRRCLPFVTWFSGHELAEFEMLWVV
jgi:hypothetical protein